MSSYFTILNQKPLPCDHCEAECCTAIPLTPTQFRKIAAALKKLPPETFERLQKQPLQVNRCMLLDRSTYQCSVYSARPPLCQIFGRHIGGVCTHAPERSSDMSPFQASLQMFDKETVARTVEGLTGLSIIPVVAGMSNYVLTWDDFKKEMAKL